MWVIHKFTPEAALETWVCPSEVRVWTWGSCLDCKDPGSARYTGELLAMGAGDMVLLGCFSLASGSSGPVRIEHGGGAAAWITGTLVAPSVQDDNSLRLRSHGTIESFSSLWQLVSKGPPWLGSFSIAWHIRHLKGHPLWGLSLLVSCWCWHVARGYRDGSTPTHDSAVLPCFHGCPAFFQRHSAPQSPPSHPLQPSPHSQQQASLWKCSPIPKLQLPDTMCSRGLASLSGLCRAAARIVFVILTPFKLSQISCCTLYSPTLFPFVLNNCCAVGVWALLQFPHPLGSGPVLLTLLFFPSSILPSSVCIRIFLSSGQGLLPNLSCILWDLLHLKVYY